LYKTTSPQLAEYVFHDLAGWLMMPLALVMLWAEMRLFRWLVVDDLRPSAAPKLLGVPKSRAPGVKPPPTRTPTSPPAASTGRSRPRGRCPNPHPEPPTPMARLIPAIIGLALLVSYGIAEGLATNRWRDSGELDRAAGRLSGVPSTLGDWTSQDEELSAREVA